ncbi:curli production assembly protein CsgG [Polynucleobacter sp. AP-Melu-500A-A1]|nr:curli production assembly protein CsgG [Polynucleobacter sp. AP-Melu-500A-A1]
MSMSKLFPAFLAISSILISGCAIQTPPLEQKEAPQSIQAQKAAQQAIKDQAPSTPTLKRKIALGRITNETVYGRSLLRDEYNDPLGKQVTDMMSKVLTESGAYLVFERPDIARVKNDVAMSGGKLNIIGVDTLIVGSLTEFGRKTVGESGFVSQSKRQVAFAKVDIRLVDTKNGQVYFAASGAGEASTETASTFGFGSKADYDGTLNDAAMRQAITDAVAKISAVVDKQPWTTYILKAEGSRIFIGGGKSQGIKEGMIFNVQSAGERIKSPQTGAEITLPGQNIATIRVISLFGEGELNEGSVASIVSGSLGGRKISDLVVRYDGAMK